MHPRIAEAATVMGLARWVRVRGPCRPSKLRFVEEMTRFCSPKVSPPAKKTHGATGLPPFKTGFAKYPVETFRFRSPLHSG